MSRGRAHSPVVKVSRVDQERIERGELDDDAHASREALREASTVAGDSRQAGIRARDANEQRLLDERPPHFGKL